MEALSEMENELQKANHAKGKSGTSENAEGLVMQLHSVQREKGVGNMLINLILWHS